ncbi:hypothetical protein [Actinomadura flavalba]|uniref:hypothetical protein n=1 Tax=Actinomadura flavalba TaxID=1120938 RepID=UPI00039B0868|nr:hypothetical protein [Actinomadura flavalba]
MASREPVSDAASVTAGDVTVTARGEVRAAAERMLGRLWIDRIAERFAAGDAASGERAVCGPAAPVDVPATPPAPGAVVVLGEGPSVRAAALLARRFGGASPIVVDGAEPGPLRRLADDPMRLREAHAVVTGGVRCEPARRAFTGLLRAAGVPAAEIAARVTVVAEPGSAAAAVAGREGHRLVAAPAPAVFGALSPYALVPAALAGADLTWALEEAATVSAALAAPDGNPGLALGAVLGGAARAGRGVVVLAASPGTPAGLAEWTAELFAGATRGRLLPVVQFGGMPLRPGPDRFLLSFGGRPHQDDATISGSPAARLAVLEYAAAVAAHLLGVEPPVAELPGAQAIGTVHGPFPEPPPAFTDGYGRDAVEVRTHDAAFAAAGALRPLLDEVARRAGDGHLALTAFLDADPVYGQGTRVRRLAGVLAARAARPVTVAWGCRYPAIGHDLSEKGVHVVLTGEAGRDVAVPGLPGIGLGPVRRAEAAPLGAGGARPVVRLHLRDREAGLHRLLECARSGT